NQFTGDGVMGLFGAPAAHEDRARRACHAALAARDDLRAYADTLRGRGIEVAVRIGINSGEVVVGKIGDDLRMDYTAQGHSVGLAARVEQLAAPGTVLLTEATAQLVEGFFELADAGVRAVKGVNAPIRVVELRGIGDAAAPGHAPRPTRELAGFMRRFFRLRSANQSGLVLIDDAHWMDRASDDLVGEIAAAVRGTRTLLLANFRPEYRPAWIG